jgi:hypothetical protein
MKHNHLNLQTTINRGILLYFMFVIITVPSGSCCYHNHLTSIEISASDQIPKTPPLPSDDTLNIRDMQTDLPQPEIENVEVVAIVNESLMEPLDEEGEENPLPPFHEQVIEAAQTYEVDPALIHAIIQAESNYNPEAVSHRGAQGLMQLMPTTARWLGVADSFDPALNIDGGVRYFKRLLDRFDGDEKLALAAYNAGSRYVRKYKGIPPFPSTRIYIKKVLAYRDQFGQ